MNGENDNPQRSLALRCSGPALVLAIFGMLFANAYGVAVPENPFPYIIGMAGLVVAAIFLLIAGYD